MFVFNMFTGIIQEIGEIKEIEKNDYFYFTIASKKFIQDLKIGSSIAIDGVCLTVLKFTNEDFTVQVMPETTAKTTFGFRPIGSKVNLESALKVGDSLDGHFVMGHVDGVGVVQKVEVDGDYWVVEITPPAELQKYIATKGSITVNGTSLTVSAVKDNGQFEISLIKHTVENTNLGILKIGDIVNLEIDMFARYIENLTKKS